MIVDSVLAIRKGLQQSEDNAKTATMMAGAAMLKSAAGAVNGNADGVRD